MPVLMRCRRLHKPRAFLAARTVPRTAEFEAAGLERNGTRALVRLAVRVSDRRDGVVLEAHHTFRIKCR